MKKAQSNNQPPINYSFTKDTAEKILKALEDKGYKIDPGLSDAEVSAVEKAFKAPLPPDLKILLQMGVILSASWQRDDAMPEWRNPEQEAKNRKKWIERAFSYDIENNNYWNELFGDKPTNIDEAAKKALDIISTWPVLFPIFSHRFIPSAPHKAGNSVVSIWQAGDSIYYGANLIDYFNKEFDLGLEIAKVTPEPVPVWGYAFDLEGVMGTYDDRTVRSKRYSNLFRGKMPDDIIEAHRHSSMHRDEILQSKKCGCFDCLKIFSPDDITEWLDNGSCAMCPKCDIDSVIGDKSGFPITKEFLTEMNQYWFGGRIAKLD